MPYLTAAPTHVIWCSLTVLSSSTSPAVRMPVLLEAVIGMAIASMAVQRQSQQEQAQNVPAQQGISIKVLMRSAKWLISQPTRL